MLGQFCLLVLTLVLNLVKTDLRCHCICKFNIFKLSFNLKPHLKFM